MTDPKPYDFLVVGSGPFGSTVARELTDAGKRVLVLEKRSYMGGNVYSEAVDGIEVHRHGPHVFHTDSARIWQYIQRFCRIIPYRQKAKSFVGGKFYSFPINLFTLNQIFGVRTPERAEALLAEMRRPRPPGAKDLETWVLSQVGPQLYKMFFRDYTIKQWGRPPRDLPELIAKRIPLRTDFNDEYFSHPYQGVPADGYGAMMRKMLEGIEVRTGVDFLKDRAYWKGRAGTVIYSGSVDLLFEEHPKLRYRTMRIEQERHEGTYQGCPTVVYPEAHVPFVRITEYKYFPPYPTPTHTIITKEFPEEYDGKNEPYYPINNIQNDRLAASYVARAEAEGYVVGGRLGRYRYFDIHQVMAEAISVAERLLKRSA